LNCILLSIKSNRVFYNCRTYNGTTSEVGAIGVSCNQEFERLINSYGVKERFCTNRGEIDYNGNVEVNNANPFFSGMGGGSNNGGGEFQGEVIQNENPENVYGN
jgi:predicted Zn-dependent protease